MFRSSPYLIYPIDCESDLFVFRNKPWIQESRPKYKKIRDLKRGGRNV